MVALILSDDVIRATPADTLLRHRGGQLDGLQSSCSATTAPIQAGCSVFAAAKDFQKRGWSLLPVKRSDKLPAVRWKRYQKQPPSPSTVRSWFRGTDHGVAIIFGEVSGHLAQRDFDEADAYHAWAERHPKLAADLPTVKTSRGFHVYCRLCPESVRAARLQLGVNVGGHGAIALGDGELRAGSGCYSVAPPSVHPSGSVYAWTVPLPDGDLPWLTVAESGFVEVASYSKSTEKPACRKCDTADTGQLGAADTRGGGAGEPTTAENDSDSNTIALTVEQAIEGSLPTRHGQRHEQVFQLARMLKAVPELRDAAAAELKPHVREWHQRALESIRTKPFEETWLDFIEAWPKVKTPHGQDGVGKAFARACSNGLPDCGAGYSPEIHLLTGLCRELQLAAGDKPFFLGCRTVAHLFERDGHHGPSRWLKHLVTDGVLELVCSGKHATGYATTYRYRGD